MMTSPAQAKKFTPEQCEIVCASLENLSIQAPFTFFASILIPEDSGNHKRIKKWLADIFTQVSENGAGKTVLPEFSISQLATHLLKPIETLVVTQRDLRDAPGDVLMESVSSDSRKNKSVSREVHINKSTIRTLRAIILQWSECDCGPMVRVMWPGVFAQMASLRYP